MSTPSTLGPTALPTFADSAAATFMALASQATATGAPDGPVLAGLLSAGAVELLALRADPAVANLSVTGVAEAAPSGPAGLGQLLGLPLLLQKSLTVALTVASAALPAGATRSRLVEVAMVAARRQAGLRIAMALAASGQLSLLGTAGLAAAAPGAAGTVGTPSDFAPVVVA